jgi:hypothetical protein
LRNKSLELTASTRQFLESVVATDGLCLAAASTLTAAQLATVERAHGPGGLPEPVRRHGLAFARVLRYASVGGLRQASATLQHLHRAVQLHLLEPHDIVEQFTELRLAAAGHIAMGPAPVIPMARRVARDLAAADDVDDDDNEDDNDTDNDDDNAGDDDDDDNDDDDDDNDDNAGGDDDDDDNSKADDDNNSSSSESHGSRSDTSGNSDDTNSNSGSGSEKGNDGINNSTDDDNINNSERIDIHEKTSDSYDSPQPVALDARAVAATFAVVRAEPSAAAAAAAPPKPRTRARPPTRDRARQRRKGTPRQADEEDEQQDDDEGEDEDDDDNDEKQEEPQAIRRGRARASPDDFMQLSPNSQHQLLAMYGSGTTRAERANQRNARKNDK